MRTMVCKSCGNPVHLDWYAGTSLDISGMLERGQCWSCMEWDDLAANRPPDLYIIKGEAFTLTTPPAPFEPVKHILHNGRAVKCSFTYNRGAVPEHFRDRLPDDTWFISLRLYNMVSRREDYLCDRMGCWGRRECIWYDESLGMDWNEIPKGLKENPEKCPMFVNRTNPRTPKETTNNKRK